MIENSSPREALISAQKVGKQVITPTGGNLTILEDIDLTLHSGEASAILGSSGSGKSTLLGLLAGLDEASSGNISLFGQSLASMSEDARAELRAGRVGFVFQSFQLLPGMTALENIMLPLELAHHSDPKGGAMETLEKVGLTQRMHHYPSQLSGGEQQRVAIARAFAAHPRLLFADEPTGSLDAATGNHISELLFDLRENTGTALLLVTHDEQLAERCDKRLR
ncbi:MAG: ATP-binding cassette domain-containing protein, partial [Candidatus Sedimenticola sp. 6PFRAG5]